MKKPLITSALVLLLVACFNACEDQSFYPISAVKDSSLQRLVNSSEFLTHQSTFTKYGTLDFENVVVKEIVVNGKSFNTVMINIVDKRKLPVAYIEAVEIGKNPYLPDGATFAINLVDTKNFDYQSSSGTVRMIDMNYNNHLHSQLTVAQGRVVSRETFDLPEELMQKLRIDSYSRGGVEDPGFEGGGYTPNPTDAVDALLCDSNSDNDLGFFECYGCLRAAIDQDGFSRFVCEAPGPTMQSCWTSVTLACLVLAAAY